MLGCKDAPKETSEVESETETETQAYDAYEVIFFDINGASFDPVPGTKIANETKSMDHLNFTSGDDFWGDKRGFLMQGLGVLTIEEAGTYYFKLTSAGSAGFQLNNVGLINHYEAHEKGEKIGSRYLEPGNAIFDLSYSPNDQEPYYVVEWSTDGENFETIPAEVIKNASLERLDPWTGDMEEDTTADNTLTEEEIAEGWQLLFDGNTTNGWHTYGNPGSIGSRWTVEDGALTFLGYEDLYNYYISGVEYQRGWTGGNYEGGRDIVSDDAFENFELMLDWKISKNGNSGIFYTVQEDPQYDAGWKTSPEMQILDNAGQKDGLISKHRAGDLYDLIPCSEIRVRPAEEWNRVKIVKNQGKVEHWLNGAMVVSFDMNTEEFRKLYENSKFSNLPNFINNGPGHISLQDHGNKVWFKNIKIKPL